MCPELLKYINNKDPQKILTVGDEGQKLYDEFELEDELNIEMGYEEDNQEYFDSFKKNLFFGNDNHQICNFIIMYFAFIKWLNEYQYTQFDISIKKSIQDQMKSMISDMSSSIQNQSSNQSQKCEQKEEEKEKKEGGRKVKQMNYCQKIENLKQDVNDIDMKFNQYINNKFNDNNKT